MTRATAATRIMAEPIAKESALVLHVEGLPGQSAKPPERRVLTTRGTVAIPTRAGLTALERVSREDRDKFFGFQTQRC